MGLLFCVESVVKRLNLVILNGWIMLWVLFEIIVLVLFC